MFHFRNNIREISLTNTLIQITLTCGRSFRWKLLKSYLGSLGNFAHELVGSKHGFRSAHELPKSANHAEFPHNLGQI